MHIFISAGEPSGDLHGANLIRALRRIDPRLRCCGFGGERMSAAGCELLYPLSRLAVMWLLRVFLNIFTFLRLLKRARNYFRAERPDALVLIDFPGFNFQLAKRAHAQGIPVYWFVPPQLWAWAGWRVKKMRRWVKVILCALPFEEDWYRDRGVQTQLVGHPFFDEVPAQQLDAAFVEDQRRQPQKVVAILPGSRMQEVTRNLPSLLRAAGLVHARERDCRFLVASFNEAQAEVARAAIAKLDLPIEVHVGRTPEIIELAEACLTVSGSVSLELMYRLKPATIIYRVGRMSLRIGRWFMTTRYITLVNLLAGEELYPEFLCDRDPADEMAEHVLRWLNEPAAAAHLRQRLLALRQRVGEPGACERAARFIVDEMRGRTAEVERPAA
jgi:lipid-A-disaccharide synthase